MARTKDSRPGVLADVLGVKAWQRGFRRVFESKGSLLGDILVCASLFYRVKRKEVWLRQTTVKRPGLAKVFLRFQRCIPTVLLA